MPNQFSNFNKLRSRQRILQSKSRAGQIMREVAFLAGQKRPQLSRLRSHVNDLLRLAVASEKPALISQLRASLTALTGNVTQTSANVVLNQMLSLAGHAGRSLRKNPPASHAQQRVSSLSRVEQLIEAMQGRPHELAPVQKVSNLSRVEEYLEATRRRQKKGCRPPRRCSIARRISRCCRPIQMCCQVGRSR